MSDTRTVSTIVAYFVNTRLSEGQGFDVDDFTHAFNLAKILAKKAGEEDETPGWSRQDPQIIGHLTAAIMHAVTNENGVVRPYNAIQAAFDLSQRIEPQFEAAVEEVALASQPTDEDEDPLEDLKRQAQALCPNIAPKDLDTLFDFLYPNG